MVTVVSYRAVAGGSGFSQPGDPPHLQHDPDAGWEMVMKTSEKYSTYCLS